MADGPPTDHHQALALAGQLCASGDSAGALEILPDLAAARPDDVAVRLLLARCLLSAGTPAVALAAADAAVACDPTSWQAQELLARAATGIDLERARAAAERAVQLAPHEPDAHSALAAVKAAAMAPSEAAEKLRRRPGGGVGAALGLRPGPAPSTPEPPVPRIEPRLPAALDPTRSAAPPAPAGVAPPAVALAPAPLATPAAGGGGETPAADAVSPARLAIRAIGLLAWLVVGFRVGVQNVGGPVGIGAFGVIVAGVAYGATRINDR